MCLQKKVSSSGLIASLVAELERGVEIVRGLSDLDFARSRDGGSSIGAHIRHNRDFVNALLNGIADRTVDYDARLRNARIENDRDLAMRELEFACERLLQITPEILSNLVMVRSEVDADMWHTSTVSREIEFLHSHTVHHYALIAKLMIDAGQEVDGEFGVAPSTRRFRSGSELRNYGIQN